MKVHKAAQKSQKYLIGIDEVGRGPIAGPVTLCAFLISLQPEKQYQTTIRHFRGIRDSKQLTAEQREVWFEKIKRLRKKGEIDLALSSISSEQIDRHGLSWAINTAVKRCLKKLTKKIVGLKPKNCLVLLDGSLKAPGEFIYQKTIIKGDEKEPVIALASIAAKVNRDRKLVGFGEKYPAYDFHIHKGYGTASHYKKISIHGICDIHRKSFLKGLETIAKSR